MNKLSSARQAARWRAARCLRAWRKTRERVWREEYRSAVRWDKRMEVTRLESAGAGNIE